MDKGIFQCKAFKIRQSMSAMKVGTDSILLSSWMHHSSTVEQVLDIGSGTGILSLQAAYRFPDASILAVEIEPDAYAECKLNVQLNEASEQITVIHEDILLLKSDRRFHLILVNPPFFEGSSDGSKRNLARLQDNLPLRSLMERAAELMTDDGLLQLIIPFSLSDKAISIGHEHDLFLQNGCYVSSREGEEPVRVLLSFGKQREGAQRPASLNIYDGHHYSKEYVELTRNVYGKDVSGSILSH